MIRRRQQRFIAWTLIVSALLTGCRPMQPYYLHEDGDLSHYLDAATHIEFADVEECTLDDVTHAHAPRTVTDPQYDSIWDLSLEEAVAITLQNSKVIRSFGQVRSFGQIVASPAERLIAAADLTPTVYDVAIQEAGQNGVEQALANFDAVFNSQTTWDKTDRQQNFVGNNPINPASFEQHTVNITNELSKLTANGTQLFFRNVNINTRATNDNTRMTRAVDTDWFTALEVEARQPLMRNRGAQVNRSPVILARLRTDITLADFEIETQNLLQTVERAYWDLFFFYHNLDAAKIGRDSALAIWKKVNALYQEGAAGGEAEREAEARQQYFFFKSRVQDAWLQLVRQEARLRFLMGIAPTDGRLIRPCNDPTTAKITFDWDAIQYEGLQRAPGLRRQRWRIKESEMRLIVARNQLLPRVDATALYRWNGLGDTFFNGRDGGESFPTPGSSALGALQQGDHQEFRMALEVDLNIGFRREMAQVRAEQLQLERNKAILQDAELELSHLLTDAIQNLDAQHSIMQSNFASLAAAQEFVEAVEAGYIAGTAALDLLLEAHRRRADSQVAYYQALVQYNEAIMNVHLRKGSIMDFHSVVMAEGPWPAKAYFDAHNLARRRDASHYINYGFSRPDVMSRGPVAASEPPTVDGVVDDYQPFSTSNDGSELVPSAVDASDGTSTLDSESSNDFNGDFNDGFNDGFDAERNDLFDGEELPLPDINRPFELGPPEAASDPVLDLEAARPRRTARQGSDSFGTASLARPADLDLVNLDATTPDSGSQVVRQPQSSGDFYGKSMKPTRTKAQRLAAGNSRSTIIGSRVYRTSHAGVADLKFRED